MKKPAKKAARPKKLSKPKVSNETKSRKRPKGKGASDAAGVSTSAATDSLVRIADAKPVDASKQEALDLSGEVRESVNTLERKWWTLTRLLDVCLKRHVPKALGLTAKEWMAKYLEGSLSDGFRKLRMIRALAGVPDEKIQSLKQANAQQLCRLPEADRKSDKWLDRAAKEPIADFKESVDRELKVQGVPVDDFGEFYLKAPKGVVEQMEAAEKKMAATLQLNTFLSEGWRILAWEAIAALVNNTAEEALQIETVGKEA